MIRAMVSFTVLVKRGHLPPGHFKPDVPQAISEHHNTTVIVI